MIDFEKLNRETQDYRNKCVDRFNPSTQSNYRFSTSNPYYPTKQLICTESKGYYDGRGQYHRG